MLMLMSESQRKCKTHCLMLWKYLWKKTWCIKKSQLSAFQKLTLLSSVLTNVLTSEKFMELSCVDQMPFIITLRPLSKLRIDHDKVIECEGGTGTLSFLISVVTYRIMKQHWGYNWSCLYNVSSNQRENNYEWVSDVFVGFYKRYKKRWQVKLDKLQVD